MLKITKSGIKEIGYNLADEAKIASVFGIGNGYFGIRGSLEEFGDVFIQGTYIRGVFDQIVEIPLTFSDNVYMKQYYFDHQKLKEFEKEDSCINICDPLFIRFYVGDNPFIPWYGKVKKWIRYIDIKKGGLFRKVIWDDGDGNLTEFSFNRYASFDDNHIIIQEAKLRRINHKLPIKILSGIDTLVKTNGQHKSVVIECQNAKDDIKLQFDVGDKYNMKVALHSFNEVNNAKYVKYEEKDGCYYSIYESNEDEVIVRKIISMYASIDPVSDYVSLTNQKLERYDVLLKNHLKAYRKAYKMIDINIEGNDEVNQLLKYANYQTLIGFDRYDSVHSLSAKNLTAEKYNQFVWWDAEIFQLPILISCFPEAAKKCLEYRYRNLNQSKLNASLEGLKGAKYAFCSSVKGDENVWIYARHPFLQIHITADVAYGVFNYYQQTLDNDFMKEKGLEMMINCMEYFYSRSSKIDNQLHLLNVTGTDEHHPYVNNDAYTNYEVNFIAKKTLKLIEKFDYEISKEIKNEIEQLANNLYLPLPNKKGIIPQFDGYLSLKSYLPITGNGSGTSFQMKASGLYHLSQIIKQPDVLNLFTYVDCEIDPSIYKANYKYYYKMCEASSSLTYPVHTICGIDFHDYDVFMKNLLLSLKIDIDDVHNCAYQGVHAGCLAGGWFAVFRGIFGFKPKENFLLVDPKFDFPFKSASINFIYRGKMITAYLNKNELKLVSHCKKMVSVSFKERTFEFKHCLTIKNIH